CLGAIGVACGAVNDVGGALTEAQTRARGLVVENEHPVYGRYEHVRGPIPTQGRDGVSPAPLLGEHTDEALVALGYSATRIALLPTSASRGARAIWAATARQWTSNSERGTTSSKRPSANASSACNTRPVLISSSARPRPTRPPSRSMPPHAGMIPSATWLNAH